jgi:hypothetical protein
MLGTARAALLGAIVAALCWAVSVADLIPARSADSLDAAARQGAVAKLADALRERYVYPDIGEKLADAITARLRAGAYDSLSDPVQFSARLTVDLSAVAHDKHLRVSAPNSPPPAGLPPPTHNEAGVVRADKLQGGIGYIEVSGFPPLAQFKPVIDRAMGALAGSKALIIDDRRNTGGDPNSVAYLISFLVPQGTHINDIVARTPNTTAFTRQEFRAQATPINFVGRPMIVLTSAATISGGEGFAYGVQSLKAAAVVGETTAGGAHTTAGLPLGPGLMASIPFGRAENVVTKTNWEGKGVSPDVAVPAADAFQVALTRLGQPAVADVAAASQSQVFAPRSTPIKGSETVLRRVIEGVLSGMPDYSQMEPQAADATRRGLEQMRQRLSALGPVQGLKFVEVASFGDDVYEVTFAHGARRAGVLMAPDGRVRRWGWIVGPR